MFAPVHNRKSVKKNAPPKIELYLSNFRGALHLPFLGFSLPYALAPIYKSGRRQALKLRKFYYTKPCAIIASATFTKPAIFAPA